MGDACLDRIGLVAIGRNEGERLRACLASVVHRVAHVVYVDSGSTDGSVALAQAMGVHVVNLDMTVPFTAARARNEGWRALLQLAPGLEFVQFVDGDCVVADGWLDKALLFLLQNPGYAVACGRRRERFPERSVYNRLCDLEWNTPVGDAKACGGDALVRVSALQQVGGYRDDLIAGEEPELCVRLRQAGWRIHRLDAEMTLHDAAMTRFGQWWKRSKRAGYAFAQGAWLHGAAPERHWVKETVSALVWGAVLPVLMLLLACFVHPAWLLLGCTYPLQIWRLRRLPGGLQRAVFLVLGKFPEAMGVLQFAWDRLWRSHGRLIEYK
ncbi:glycosyltransferase [Extensimonas sp. H3M7-6]|uniref:glycosyltransferase n=1 Tax=Extensimonas soli TaxID=3031322 RepID=UPI0023DAA74E|nr:glycosyltransferase family 2 protein [Extensimonas sp. H3M7-6]MDF1483437.1 glycosyltransferase family 2 protein [Extensimonas sp. H3M7-6]